MTSIIPLPVEALTPTIIRQAVKNACCQCNEEQCLWSFRVASDSDLAKWRDLRSPPMKNGFHQLRCLDDEPLLYGVVATSATSNEDPSPLGGATLAYATFYMAYSTWDGRVLYLDQVNNTGNERADDLESKMRQCLARAAILLECSRFTWQQWGAPKATPTTASTFGSTPVAEHLEGWLTLHWSRSSMLEFLGGSNSSDTITANARAGTRAAISDALNSLNLSPVDEAGVGPAIRLRLATSDDVEIIGRLVQGLADFEKEPDAVHVTTRHYQQDGFDGHPPLFYCVLLDSLEGNENPSASPSTYTFGMALVNFQESLKSGRFLYLEDLFIEEPYRGLGGGGSAMRALAKVSVSLSCSRMVWQALHWNTPALTFYGKLGAKVQVGLETLRYTGSALEEFTKM
jgi:GNAT superfamily N-acetyltransferase